MNKQFKRMQKLAGILTEGYQGTDYESSEDMALDMVKTGAGMPGTGLPEVKKKMTKAEAKQAIKDAILAEMAPEEVEEIAEASLDAMDRMDSLVSQDAKTEFFKAVSSFIRDLKMEGFEDDDIFDYIMDLVKTLPLEEGGGSLKEAKKDKEEDEDEVKIEDEETVEEPVADEDMVDADMEGDLDLDAGSDEAKDAFDELTDAYRSAKELGDEKLIRQLANTITYFNKNIILK